MYFETNIFPITNLDQLTSQYRLYKIKGLNREQDDYFRNRQIIIRRLSYQLGSPITIVERAGSPHMVVKSDTEGVPETFNGVGRFVEFEALSDEFTLDYTTRSPENDAICIRFLQFMFQAPLQKNRELWQLGSGQPFFYTAAFSATSAVNRYLGFSVRVVVTHIGGLGFCIDTTNKFVAKQPLPTKMNRDEYARWHGQHCIYHYGHDWFSIKLAGFSDYNVSDHKVPVEKGFVPLLNYINDDCRHPFPPELARLRHDASVVHYQNNRGEERSAPTPLCYPVLGSNHRLVRPLHRSTLLRPYKRREYILQFANRYLTKLKFGDQQVRVARKPTIVKRRTFDIPDIEFGNSKKISTTGTKGATYTSVEGLGKTRARFISNKNVGFFVSDPLATQYLIIPESVADSYGESLKTDLSSVVDAMFPQEHPYTPIVVAYNDRVPNTFNGQGSQILATLDEECQLPGYALVMIHNTDDKKT